MYSIFFDNYIFYFAFTLKLGAKKGGLGATKVCFFNTYVCQLDVKPNPHMWFTINNGVIYQIIGVTGLYPLSGGLEPQEKISFVCTFNID